MINFQNKFTIVSHQGALRVISKELFNRYVALKGKWLGNSKPAAISWGVPSTVL